MKKFKCIEKLKCFENLFRWSISKFWNNFLKRYFQYVFKFSKNLNQKKYWNINLTVFINWFDLYDYICVRYNINNKNQYNINEKNYMIKVDKTEK